MDYSRGLPLSHSTTQVKEYFWVQSCSRSMLANRWNKYSTFLCEDFQLHQRNTGQDLIYSAKFIYAERSIRFSPCTCFLQYRMVLLSFKNKELLLLTLAQFNSCWHGSSPRLGWTFVNLRFFSGEKSELKDNSLAEN